MTVTTGIKDLKGNSANDTFTSDFRIINIPQFIDTDGDGLSDELESMLTQSGYGYAFNPLNSDSDGDGTPDGEEDFDSDGLTNSEEFLSYGTNLVSFDSDSDRLSDFDEINEYGTNPINNDTDGDFLTDGIEVLDLETNPLTIDTDGDLLEDGIEDQFNLDPTVANTTLPHSVSAPVVIYHKTSTGSKSLSATVQDSNPTIGGEE